MTWDTYPTMSFRNDTDVEYTVNITNIGTGDANNTNITLAIPVNWTFAPGNSSLQTFNLSIGEKIQITWYVNISENASLGNQTINVTAISSIGLNETISISVIIIQSDFVVRNFYSPVNNSCSFSKHVNVTVEVNNSVADDKNNTNISFYMDGTLNLSKLVNFSSYEIKNVTFEYVLLPDEKE